MSSPFPQHQGGSTARASQVWGTTIHHVPYGLIWSPPPHRTSTEIAEVPTQVAEAVAEVVTDSDAQHDRTDTEHETRIQLDSGWHVGRWLARVYILINITIARRRR